MKTIAVTTLNAMWNCAVALAGSGCQDCNSSAIGFRNGATSAMPITRLARLPSGRR